jgi:hypothetical protein
MPSIMFDGVRYSQVSHSIQCRKCGTVIESKSNHDYRECKCGAVAVDGGIGGGNRILGELDDFDDRSKYLAIDPATHKKIWLNGEALETFFAERKAFLKTQEAKQREGYKFSRD